MTAPAFEVADILRVQGEPFLQRYGSSMDYQQQKAFFAIRNCRTAALGGHIDICPKCRHESRNFNSCRNRSCPKCQGRARRRWIAAREREVLDTPYFHVVFTVPKELNLLALNNQRVIYNLLFQAAAKTTLEVAANPDRLGAEIGILSILHTWGQNLREHPHIHCVIPQGGISSDHTQWIQPRYRYFLPKKVLSLVFRGKFMAGLKRLYRNNKLRLTGSLAALSDPMKFSAFLRQLHRYNWVIDIRPAFGGPMQVIRYLGRYTHRVAISNHRLLDFDGDRVTFLWKDYAHGAKWGPLSLQATEFLRRFFLHVLPKGFVRIRSFGFLANRFRRQRLALCRTLLADIPEEITPVEKCAPEPMPDPSTCNCPLCGTPMQILFRFKAWQWYSRGSFYHPCL